MGYSNHKQCHITRNEKIWKGAIRFKKYNAFLKMGAVEKYFFSCEKRKKAWTAKKIRPIAAIFNKKCNLHMQKWPGLN